MPLVQSVFNQAGSRQQTGGQTARFGARHLRVMALLWGFSVMLSGLTYAGGLIPGTYPIYSGQELEVKKTVTINGQMVAEGKTSPDAVITINGQRETVAQTLPALAPPTFPTNTSNTDAIEADSPFVHATEVFYKKIKVRKNSTVVFDGGGPFHIDVLDVKKNVTLNFAAGTYFIDTLKIDKDTVFNLTSEPVILHIGHAGKVKKDVVINSGGTVAGLRVFLHAGATFKADKGLNFTGVVYGPTNKEVKVNKDTLFRGAIITGGKIKLDKNIAITYTVADQAAVSAIDTADTGGGDTTPPVVTPPAAITVPAQNAGGTFASHPLIEAFLNGATALDNVDGVLEAFGETPILFPLGETVFVFSATDAAGNTGTATARVTVVDLSPPSIVVPGNITVVPPDLTGLPSTDFTLQLFLNSARAFDNVDAVLPVSHDAPSTFPLGTTVVTFTATDSAGNTASESGEVLIQDATPPVLGITEPRDLDSFNTGPVVVLGTIDDPNATVTVNGITAISENGTFVAEGVALQEGPNQLTAIATDLFGNTGQTSIQVSLLIPPQVTILQPANLSVVNQETITVSGTVDDPTATVEVNGVTATINGGAFTANAVPIREGNNVLTAAATAIDGVVGTASVQVTKDSSPPIITIETPTPGSLVTASSVTVSGMINDIVVGTVNGQQAQVTVNGIAALVSNRHFLATDIPLSFGGNTLTVIGTDQAGNMVQTSIGLTRQDPGGQAHLSLVNGNNQTAPILTTLPAPLSVILRDATGSPVVGQGIIFRVTKKQWNHQQWG